jgi:hypothetical protein
MKPLALLLVLLAAPAAAQTTYSWNGANPGDWATPTNWLPNGVPGSADAVVIGSGQPVLSADATVADATLNGGALSGDGNLTVTGTFTWAGGTLNGRDFAETAALTIPAGATLQIQGELDKVLRGRDVFNDGTITWEGTGNLVVAWGTLLENRAGATFDVRSDAVLTRSNGTLVLQNDGLLVKSSGTGTTSLSYPFGQFVNDGTVRVEVGTLLLNNGASAFSAAGDGTFVVESGATLRFNQATYNFGAGSSVAGEGTLLTTGGTALLGTAALTGPTVVAGGALQFTSVEAPAELSDMTVSAGNLGGVGVKNVNGLLTWSGGSLGTRFDNTGVLNLLGGVSAEGEAAKTFAGGTYNNAATFTWTGTGDLVVNTGGTFNNLEGALFDIRNDAVWTRSNGTLTFVNGGLVTKSGGAGTTTIQTPFAPFNNDGEVRVETGTLHVNVNSSGSASTDTGAWVVEEGAALLFNSHQRTLTEAASLGGTGSVGFGNATIINRGTVRPGLSLGTLAVQGDSPAPQPEGVLEIELGGTTPGVEHDVFAVTNIANLGGVLRLVLADGFEPTGDEALTVVTALAVQGEFAGVEPPEGYVAEVTYNAQDVTVRAVPVFGCADGLQPDEHTLALYKFDEPLPGTSFDASGNGLDADDDGTEVVVGRFCNARRFDGVDDLIDVDVARAAMQGQTAWTLEYVAKSEGGSELPFLMNHACGNGWALRPAAGSVGFWIKTTAVGGNCPWAVQGNASAELGTDWHYYALTWDGAALSAYRDGALLGSEPAGGVFLENQGSGFGAWIGHDDFTGAYHAGLADDLRVSDVARGGEELCATADVLGFPCSTTASEGEGRPTETRLHAPSPTPAVGVAAVAFDLAEAVAVRVAVYDVLGRVVALLVDGERPAGRYEVALPARALAGGAYLVRMTTGGASGGVFSQTQRVTLLR